MTDAGKKQQKGAFKKSAHRPWKSLAQTIDETTIDLESSLFDLDIDLDFDLNLDLTETIDPSYPKFGLTEKIIKVAATPIPETTQISETPKESIIITPIIDNDSKINDKILLGGFFKTKQHVNETNVETTRNLNAMLADLKARENKIEANEARMRQAIEQASIISQQFEAAVAQVNEAANNQISENNLRKQAENQLKEIQIRINNMQIDLHNEKQLRFAAETKVQQTQITTTKYDELKHQSQDAIDKLMHTELEKNSVESKLFELQEQYDKLDLDYNSLKNESFEMQEQYDKLDLDYNSLKHELFGMQQQYDNFDLGHTTTKQELLVLQDKYTNLNNELAILESHHKQCAQHDKLKAIIATERKLRKFAESQLPLHLPSLQVEPEVSVEDTQQEVIIAYDYEPDDLTY